MTHAAPRTLSSYGIITLLTLAALFAPVQHAHALITDTSPLASLDSSDESFSHTQELLSTASDLALESASFAQKFPTLALGGLTTEVLKQYASLTQIQAPEPAAAAEGRPEQKLIAFNPRKFKGFGFIKLSLPLGMVRISSPFGTRWGRPHQGTDFSAPIGTPVKAAEAGTVTFAGWKGGYGKFVVVDHGQGVKTHYAHLSGIGVRAGQKVNRGAAIGRVGNTGHSTGPHLHFEVVANGRHLNPEQYLHKQAPTVAEQPAKKLETANALTMLFH